MRRPRGLLLRVAFVTAISLVAPPAVPAEPTTQQLAEARDWFAKARRLEDTGQWSDALELLQRVAAVKTTPQVRFHIALCMENVGLLTQALEGFQLAAREASPGAPDVVRESTEHVRTLERRIPTVTVNVTGAGPSDELLFDRRSIPMGEPPLPIRVDPGLHTAEVRRGDAVVARELFVIEPAATRRIELKVGPITAEPGTTQASSGTAPPSETAAPTTAPAQAAPPADAGRGSTQRVLGWTALALSAASVAATGIFIGLRAGKLDDLEKACPELTRCSPAVNPVVSDGSTYATLVNVFAVGAGAMAVAGAVLLLTAPAPVEPAPATEQHAKGRNAATRRGRFIGVAPIVTGSGAGLTVGGRF